ncbi:MAG: hypothetical protein JJU45_14315 [Acidimicrobiia bacterium]|nr:hypothetical protein [Acidimicrobiia bacterium]
MRSWYVDDRCVDCGDAVVAPATVCRRCATTLRRPARLPTPPAPLTTWSALARHDGAGRALVLALKSGDRRMVRAAGRLMSEELEPLTERVTVTWAPTGLERRRQRGYDQSQELARWLGRWARCPVRRLLLRPPDVGPQHGRSASQRRGHVRFRPVRRCSGPVVVVDDVITTGSTVLAAAEALVAAGATSVHAVALTTTDGWDRPGAGAAADR